MKIRHNGFTLTELLLALGIISVIITLGLNISKRSIDRAYDTYIYTSYSGISQAISEAETKGYLIEDNNIGNCNFTKTIVELLSGKIKETYTDTVEFTTPNNIMYKLINITSVNNGIQKNNKKYLIRATLPSKKGIYGYDTKTKIYFAYLPDGIFDILIPIDSININGKVYNSNVQIANRVDLLPFYKEEENQKKEYQSAHDILCETYHKVEIAGSDNYNCPQSTNPTPDYNVLIKLGKRY